MVFELGIKKDLVFFFFSSGTTVKKEFCEFTFQDFQNLGLRRVPFLHTSISIVLYSLYMF